MFLTELIVRRIIGVKNCWQTVEPLIWDGGRDEIVVPAGFICNGASVPAVFAFVLPKAGERYDRAACLHDFLYATRRFDRKKCDEIFYEAMKFDKVAKWKAWAIYKSVRVFGGRAYANHKALDPEKIKI